MGLLIYYLTVCMIFLYPESDRIRIRLKGQILLYMCYTLNFVTICLREFCTDCYIFFIDPCSHIF